MSGFAEQLELIGLPHYDQLDFNNPGEVIVYKHYYNPFGEQHWFIVSRGGKGNLFGYVILIPEQGGEWGFVPFETLNEFANLIPITQDFDWKPTKVKDIELIKTY